MLHSRRRATRLVIAAVSLIAVVAMTGCKAAGDLLAGMNKPSASVTGARLTSPNADAAGLTFDVKISNPYAVAIPLANLDYALASDGKAMLEGKAALSGSVPAKGSSVVAVPVNIRFADVMNAVSGIKLGSVVPYKADLTLSSEVPGIGPISLPMNHSGEFPVPAVPIVEVADVKWDELGLTGVAGALSLKVSNPNQFDIDLSKLGYMVKLGGREIASGAAKSGMGLSAGKNSTITIPFKLSAMQAGMAVLDMAKSATASYEVRGDLDVKTRFGDLSMPYVRTGTTSQSGK